MKTIDEREKMQKITKEKQTDRKELGEQKL